MSYEVMSTLSMLSMCDFDVFVDVVAAEVYREITELKRKASTVGTEIAKKGGRQKNLEAQTSRESVYL